MIHETNNETNNETSEIHEIRGTVRSPDAPLQLDFVLGQRAARISHLSLGLLHGSHQLAQVLVSAARGLQRLAVMVKELREL